MKKFVALFLVFSLLALSGNLYAKKRGAELEIWGKGAKFIKGELIAVKKNTLLLLESGIDVTIDIKDVRFIRIVKKSKVLQGLGFGLLIGAGSGALLYVLQGYDPSDFLSSPDAGNRALVGGIAGGFFGILIGGILSIVVAKDKTILIEGKSPRWIEWNLKELRKKARIPDW